MARPRKIDYDALALHVSLGETAKEIAAAFGTSEASVRFIAKRLGLSIEPPPKRDLEAKIRLEWASGERHQGSIATKVGCSRSTVSNVVNLIRKEDASHISS